MKKQSNTILMSLTPKLAVNAVEHRNDYNEENLVNDLIKQCNQAANNFIEKGTPSNNLYCQVFKDRNFIEEYSLCDDYGAYFG